MQTKKQPGGIVAGILLPMGLVCLFAGCSLFLALLGGRAYRDIQGAAEDSLDSTVVASYLRTKLGGAGYGGAVQLREVDGTQVLVIASTAAGRPYETRIYVYQPPATADDPAPQPLLVERYQAADTPHDGVGGMQIAQVQSCTFTLEGGLFTADITSPAGTHITTTLALPEGGVL